MSRVLAIADLTANTGRNLSFVIRLPPKRALVIHCIANTKGLLFSSYNRLVPSSEFPDLSAIIGQTFIDRETLKSAIKTATQAIDKLPLTAVRDQQKPGLKSFHIRIPPEREHELTAMMRKWHDEFGIANKSRSLTDQDKITRLTKALEAFREAYRNRGDTAALSEWNARLKLADAQAATVLQETPSTAPIVHDEDQAYDISW